jgi:hypothetical protein
MTEEGYDIHEVNYRTLNSLITESASYPLTSIVVDFLRPLLLCLTVWR